MSSRKLVVSIALILVSATLLSCQQNKVNKPQNIIFMISDGLGPSAITAAREYYGELSLDEILVGTIQTRSHSSAVTDSAAGATAFATGVRTYNRAVSVAPDKTPLVTLLEDAKAQGMKTGLVATSPIAHATPAAFSAHAVHRKLMYDIAQQQAESGTDLLLAGGYDDWLPKEQGGCRTDGRNLLNELHSKGYQKAVFQKDSLNIPALPAIGLFAKGNLDYMIDHSDSSGPTLQQMTSKALSILSRQTSGFFLMIEGSRIDHAAHVNDPVSKLHEIKSYDDTVRTVLDFARKDGRTLVISVSDHETGGMTIGRRTGDKSYYKWRPDVLRSVKASTNYIANRIIAGDDPKMTVLKYTGLETINKQEQAQLTELAMQARQKKKTSSACSSKWYKKDLPQKLKNRKKISAKKRLMYWIGERISREAHIGWTTYGHTGIDVNLYAFGPSHEKFRGSHKNTHIAAVIAELMQFTRVRAQIKQHTNR